MTAVEAIRSLMARYNVEGDRARIEALATCFAMDGVLTFSGESTVGRAAIVARLTRGGGRANPHHSFSRHHLTTSLIEVTGDTATGRSYFQVLTDIGLDHHGVYVDHFTRTADGWRIAHREVRIDWQSPQSVNPRLWVRGVEPA
jgi:hypothetical protein